MSFNLIRYCSINPVWTSPAALPLQDFCSLQWLPAHWHQSASRNRHGKFTLKQARRDCIAVYLHKRSTRIPHVMYILRKPWLSRSAFPRYDYIEHRLRCFICQPLDLCHRRVSSDKIIQPRNSNSRFLSSLCDFFFCRSSKSCMIAFQVNSAYNLKPEIVCFQFKLPIWAIALDVFILRLDFFIVVNAHGNDGIAHPRK